MKLTYFLLQYFATRVHAPICAASHTHTSLGRTLSNWHSYCEHPNMHRQILSLQNANAGQNVCSRNQLKQNMLHICLLIFKVTCLGDFSTQLFTELQGQTPRTLAQQVLVGPGVRLSSCKRSSASDLTNQEGWAKRWKTNCWTDKSCLVLLLLALNLDLRETEET